MLTMIHASSCDMTGARFTVGSQRTSPFAFSTRTIGVACARVPSAANAKGDVLWEPTRSEEHTSELQSLTNIVCRLLLEKKKKNRHILTVDRAVNQQATAHVLDRTL